MAGASTTSTSLSSLSLCIPGGTVLMNYGNTRLWMNWAWPCLTLPLRLLNSDPVSWQPVPPYAQTLRVYSIAGVMCIRETSYARCTISEPHSCTHTFVPCCRVCSSALMSESRHRSLSCTWHAQKHIPMDCFVVNHLCRSLCSQFC